MAETHLSTPYYWNLVEVLSSYTTYIELNENTICLECI